MAQPFLKKLERGLKAVVLRAVESGLPRRRLPPPDWDAHPWRVLYLRYDRIGDMIMSTGLIRAIAGSHATIQLDVLASPSNAPVLQGNPHVHEVIVFNRRSKTALPGAWRELRRRKYDVVVDGGVTAPSVTTMLLMMAAGAPYRIGLAGGANEGIYTLPVQRGGPDASFLMESARTAQPFGVPLQGDWRPELFLTDDEKARAESIWSGGAGSPRLLLNVSAFTADRRWPKDRSAALVAHLRKSVPGSRILVTGDPGDWSTVQEVAAAGGAQPVNVSPVREVFALVAGADALITPDTSLSHAASAVGTPFAVLFRGDWLHHMPQAANLVPIISPGSTLNELPLGQALAAMDRLLALARERARGRSAMVD